MEVQLFDWFRWIEAPVLIALLGLIVRHAMHDHLVEVRLTELITRAVERTDAIEKLESRIDRRLELIEWKIGNPGHNIQPPPPASAT